MFNFQVGKHLDRYERKNKSKLHGAENKWTVNGWKVREKENRSGQTDRGFVSWPGVRVSGAETFVYLNRRSPHTISACCTTTTTTTANYLFVSASVHRHNQTRNNSSIMFIFTLSWSTLLIKLTWNNIVLSHFIIIIYILNFIHKIQFVTIILLQILYVEFV